MDARILGHEIRCVETLYDKQRAAVEVCPLLHNARHAIHWPNDKRDNGDVGLFQLVQLEINSKSISAISGE